MNDGAHPRLQRWFTPILIVFLAGGLILFGIASWYSEGSAEITLTPRGRIISVSFTLPYALNTESTTETLGVTMSEQSLSQTVEVPPSTDGVLVDAHAGGTMEVVNLTGTAQPLAVGTRFRSTNGIVVRSTRRIDVPAKGRTTVPVTADPLGPSGNLPPGKFVIVALWPGLQSQIFGQTSEALTGGQVRKDSTLSIGDLTAASDTAQEKIREKFGTSSDGVIRILRPKSVRTVPDPDQPSDVYRVTVTMTGQAFTYKTDDLHRFIEEAVRAKLEPGNFAASREPATVTVGSEERTFHVSLNTISTLDPSAEIFRPESFRSLSKSLALKKIQDNSGILRGSVTLRPNWRDSLPTDTRRIKITVLPAET